MALLNAVVLTSKTLNDGKNKVRISVAHNGETRYIVTDIILNSNKEFKNGRVVKRDDAAWLNTKIRNLLLKYQSTLDELVYANGLTCAELVYQLQNAGKNKHRTLNSIYEEYIAYADITPGTRHFYRTVWNNVVQFIGDKFLAEHVTHSTVLGLDKFLRNKSLKSTTICMYMTFFKVVLKYALRCGYIQFRLDPFFGYKFPIVEVRQSWLSIEEIKTIRDLKTSKSNIAKCRDVFMLSYYLGGINMIDLLGINFNEQTDTIKYVRKKTENRRKVNKYVEFRIPEEAKAIINRYKGSNGLLNISRSQYSDICQGFLIYNLNKISELTGIKQLIYYSARKSFAQHAFNLGISEGVIDYILGHRVDRGGTSLYAYISVTPEIASAAVRKVLDNLKN